MAAIEPAVAVSEPVTSNGFAIREFGPEEHARWDEWVRRSPQGTLFHSTLWLHASGGPFKLLGLFRGTEMRAGLAIGVETPGYAGHLCAALTPYQGPLLPPPSGKRVTENSASKEILATFAAYLKAHFQGVFMRLPPELSDLQPFIWEGYAPGILYTYRFAIDDLDAVWKGIDSSRRRAIRSAEKAGVVIEQNAPFADVLALSERSFQRQGKALEFREAATRYVKALSAAGQCCSFVARTADGQGIGAVFIAWDTKRAYYLIGGYDDASEESGAVALAMWKAIRHTREVVGLKEFDFEGSMIPAVERFFRKFGGVLTPTYTVSLFRQRPLPERIAAKLKRLTGAGQPLS